VSLTTFTHARKCINRTPKEAWAISITGAIGGKVQDKFADVKRYRSGNHLVGEGRNDWLDQCVTIVRFSLLPSLVTATRLNRTYFLGKLRRGILIRESKVVTKPRQAR
jgi:hypothetical protein